MKLHNDTAPDYKPLLLMRNVSFPTYQLHAMAGGGATPPGDVLKIVVLETVAWLRQRFRAFELPPELDMPTPDDFSSLDLAQLRSFRLDMGYKLSVIWLPELWIWALQLTEPDLGARPGDQNQPRPPVPGRLFETNITYRAMDSGVECGFKTVVHEPQGTEVFCEVFRLAFIKNLARNPLVGLSQTWRLVDMAHRLDELPHIRRLSRWLRDPQRMMPAVIFAEHVPEQKPLPESNALRAMVDSTAPPTALFKTLPYPTTLPPAAPAASVPTMPMELSALARYRMSFAQFFLVAAPQRELFTATTGIAIERGETLVLEADALGGAVTRYPFGPTARDREKNRRALDFFIQNYPKGKAMDFGGCVFVPEARVLEFDALRGAHKSLDALIDGFGTREEAIRTEHQRALLVEQSNAKKQEDRLQKEIEALERDKKGLLDQLARKQAEHQAVLGRLEAHLSRQDTLKARPQRPEDVADWVEATLAGHLVFHERARREMQRVPAGKVELALLCDALEYLAHPYRDALLGDITQAERDLRCAEIYNRPFVVVPTKSTSMEIYRSNYVIKYHLGYKGKPVESLLDLHLKVGTGSENLLRIYFLYDKGNKLVVVGSLPEHLKIKSFK